MEYGCVQYCFHLSSRSSNVMFQAMIRKELNQFKSTEMDVHEESKQFTRLVFIVLFASTTIRHSVFRLSVRACVITY